MIRYKIITKEDDKKLNNLLQLYLHDISKFFPVDFDSKSCLYLYDKLDKYYDDSENYALLFMDDNEIVGFSLIDKNELEYVVQEMFVLNNYKNKGLGEECITKVFNDFRGNWVIKSLPCSPKSENFWNKTIKNYTNDSYSIEHIGKYNRAVFRFSNINE